jgi:hypothetical protein
MMFGEFRDRLKKLASANMNFSQTCRSLPVTNDGCPIAPDFLRRLVALIHFMRLSSMKGAHADLSGTAWQESGSSRVLA